MIRSKYHNKKVTLDGMIFDSRKEANRFQELYALLKAGDITGLERQVPFELIPAQRVNGRVVERSCKYIADFVYQTKSRETVVEDTKGVRTPDYVIKRKLMLYRHGIQIKEV